MSSEVTQTAWKLPNIVGHSIDPYTKECDHTEGFGVIDSIFRKYSLGGRTIDVGGGKWDFNSGYLYHRFDVEQCVYDPFMRSKEHNDSVLALARKRPFPSCISASVLNVIDNKKARLAHIKLCYDVIREGGKAFFKVWPGDGSGISITTDKSFQSNLNLEHYFEEIASVFGSQVFLDKKNKLIRCIKPFLT